MRRLIPHVLLGVLTLASAGIEVVSLSHQSWQPSTVAPSTLTCSEKATSDTVDTYLSPRLAKSRTKLQAIRISATAPPTPWSSFLLLAPSGGHCDAQIVARYPNSDGTPGYVVAAVWSGETTDSPALTVMASRDFSGASLICNLSPRALRYVDRLVHDEAKVQYLCPPLPTSPSPGADGVYSYETFDITAHTNATVAGGFIRSSPPVSMEVQCVWNEPANAPYSCKDLIASIFKNNQTR